jgi:hypothetical protein
VAQRNHFLDAFDFRASRPVDSLFVAKRICGLRGFVSQKAMRALPARTSDMARHVCVLHRVFDLGRICVDSSWYAMSAARPTFDGLNDLISPGTVDATDSRWQTAERMSRRELLACIFWLCEGLVVGIPILLAGGEINTDREVDLAGWSFVAGRYRDR